MRARSDVVAPGGSDTVSAVSLRSEVPSGLCTAPDARWNLEALRSLFLHDDQLFYQTGLVLGVLAFIAFNAVFKLISLHLGLISSLHLASESYGALMAIYSISIAGALNENI